MRPAIESHAARVHPKTSPNTTAVGDGCRAPWAPPHLDVRAPEPEAQGERDEEEAREEVPFPEGRLGGEHQLRVLRVEEEPLGDPGPPHPLLGEIRPHRHDGPDHAERRADRDPPRHEAMPPLGTARPLDGEAEAGEAENVDGHELESLRPRRRVQQGRQHLRADEHRQRRVNRSPAHSARDAEGDGDAEGGQAEKPIAGERKAPDREERSGESAPEDEEERLGLLEPGPPADLTSQLMRRRDRRSLTRS